MPDRVVRQFGYVQVIPLPPYPPQKVYRGISVNKYTCIHDPNKVAWLGWNHHMIRLDDIAFPTRFAAETSKEYMDWFRPRTRRLVSFMAIDDDEELSSRDADDMHPVPRLQYLASILYPFHPWSRRPLLPDVKEQLFDMAINHLTDYMPFTDEERHSKGKGRGKSRGRGSPSEEDEYDSS